MQDKVQFNDRKLVLRKCGRVKIFWNKGNMSKFYLLGNKEQIKFGDFYHSI